MPSVDQGRGGIKRYILESVIHIDQVKIKNKTPANVLNFHSQCRTLEPFIF